MNTAYYTVTTWNDGAMAAGFDAVDGTRQAAAVRQSGQGARPRGGDNVIDLNAWRAANQDLEPEAAGEREAGWSEPEELGLNVPAPRYRKSRRAAVLAELASTAGVVAAALAIILRVVVF